MLRLSTSLLAKAPRPSYLFEEFWLSSAYEDTTMMAFDNASDLRNAALGREISLAKFAEWEKRARTEVTSSTAVLTIRPPRR